ncbi:CPBP family intramembrane glutamic endopeptidase [Microbulbifer sediminum]|uniref:CPBP family intramembrane glutamic endopeptidase n=1 Tax=Microbulbifer sediminum TaxID=2904250 RepID=UPI001F3E6CCA|nr:CPBP family intramembrane glutamic endopeptidase [Microbulbifer sediminum]
MEVTDMEIERQGLAPLLPPRVRAFFIPAALTLCILPFGWVGVAAPLAWLALNGIERSTGWSRALLFVAAAAIMLLAALGTIPSAPRIELLPPYSDSAGNSIGNAFNPGKAAIAVAVMVFMAGRKQRPLRQDLPLLLLLVLLPIVVAIPFSGFSPKLSATILLAMLVNLAVVCISEEAFFRWVLQRGAEELLGQWRWLAVPPVVAIFTLLHTGWAASPPVLALVALAGFAYATLWYLRRKFWLCVLAHWGVNSLHMLLLTYPLG